MSQRAQTEWKIPYEFCWKFDLFTFQKWQNCENWLTTKLSGIWRLPFILEHSACQATPITLVDIPECWQWQSSSTNYKHMKVLASSSVSLQVTDKSNGSMTMVLVFFSANFLAVLLISYTRSHRFLVVIFFVYKSSAAVSAGVHSRLILQHNSHAYMDR